ncbi:hypothetical protein PRNP1_010379 [Phytophthora ramorum]
MIKGEADKLQLFLAKEDNSWLDAPGAANVAIDQDGGYQERQVLWREFSSGWEPISRAPTQRGVRNEASDGICDDCTEAFFINLPMVREDGDWLRFSLILPLTARRELYIRPAYSSIADQAVSRENGNCRHGAIITGTPGIGKSVLPFYVMIQEKKRVLFFSRS